MAYFSADRAVRRQIRAPARRKDDGWWQPPASNRGWTWTTEMEAEFGWL